MKLKKKKKKRQEIALTGSTLQDTFPELKGVFKISFLQSCS